MSEVRPIDANALKEALKCGAYSSVLKLIDRQPTLDYEPVVHCKDCKHLYMNCGRLMCKRTAKKNRYRGQTAYYGVIAVTENHFCSYGAKMDEEVKPNANNNS